MVSAWKKKERRPRNSWLQEIRKRMRDCKLNDMDWMEREEKQSYCVTTGIIVRGAIACLLRNKGWEVHEEVRCISEDDSHRRADIIEINRQQQKAIIVDPTIRMERDLNQAHQTLEQREQTRHGSQAPRSVMSPFSRFTAQKQKTVSTAHFLFQPACSCNNDTSNNFVLIMRNRPPALVFPYTNVFGAKMKGSHLAEVFRVALAGKKEKQKKKKMKKKKNKRKEADAREGEREKDDGQGSIREKRLITT
ncbi:hypothetical protein ANN_12375 [Periplaneta americana]|uniref:Uncharacterized protein n=1 Tax=Periplaneta americana TaxID=6978 RepID=A0ABQ8TGL6_PERAM|nr:hypothetical protein ANN_12375 [Periplaneta americana]